MAEKSEKDLSVAYVIDADHLTWVEDRLVDELGTYIEEKLPSGTVIDRSGKNVLIGFTESRINKRKLKLFLKKFLHKFELKEKFRVVSMSDEEYKIQKRKDYDFREL